MLVVVASDQNLKKDVLLYNFRMMGIFGIILTLMGMFVVESYQTEELVHNASYSVVFRLTQTGLTYGKRFVILYFRVFDGLRS